jgi:hypothetical protein
MAAVVHRHDHAVKGEAEGEAAYGDGCYGYEHCSLHHLAI